MRVRHRIPSIFNLSMVDVLCCALGCVILLWLVNLREAKEHEDTAAAQSRRSAELLETAQAERDRVYASLRRGRGQGQGRRGGPGPRPRRGREADRRRPRPGRQAQGVGGAHRGAGEGAGGVRRRAWLRLEDAARRDAARLRELKAVAAAVPGAARRPQVGPRPLRQRGGDGQGAGEGGRPADALGVGVGEAAGRAAGRAGGARAGPGRQGEGTGRGPGYKDKWSASEERCRRLERPSAGSWRRWRRRRRRCGPRRRAPGPRPTTGSPASP